MVHLSEKFKNLMISFFEINYKQKLTNHQQKIKFKDNNITIMVKKTNVEIKYKQKQTKIIINVNNKWNSILRIWSDLMNSWFKFN